VKKRVDLLQGTLDMLVLKTLSGGSMHGYGISRKIQGSSEDALRVEEGSLYPALHRLERRGFLVSEWGLSEANRRAKYYRLTRKGRTRLRTESAAWERFAKAVALVMRGRPEGA